MNTSKFIRYVLAGASLLAAAPALADVVIPPSSPCLDEAARNHGAYVSCVAHHKELWGENGNSDAGRSDIGK